MTDPRGPIILSPATTELHLVGVSFHQDALKDNEGPVDVSLIPEPTNPYDATAIAAYVGRSQIGHLPKGFNSLYGKLIATYEAHHFDLSWHGYIGEWEHGYYARIDVPELELIVRAIDNVEALIAAAKPD